MKRTEGGFDEISYVTRLIPSTSFVILLEIFLKTSGGNINLHWTNAEALNRFDERIKLTSLPS